MPMMGFREYGRSRKERGLTGGTLQAVRDAVRTGRIQSMGDRIDSEAADAEWERNTNPNLQRKSAARTPEEAEALARAPVPPPAEGMPDAAECVRRRTWWQAEGERLKVEAAKGDLVPRQESERTIEAATRLIQDTLDAAVESGAVHMHATWEVPLGVAREWLRGWYRECLNQAADVAEKEGL